MIIQITKRQFGIKKLCMYFCIALLTVPFIGVANFSVLIGFQKFSWINVALKYMRYIDTIIMTFGIFVYKIIEKKRNSQLAILIAISYLYLVIITLSKGGTHISQLIYVIIQILFWDLILFQDAKYTISLVGILNFFAFLNFLCILAYSQEGGLISYSVNQRAFYKGNYFLGYDNAYIVLCLPLICLNFSLYYMLKRKIYLLFAIMCIISELMINSACTYIGMIVGSLFFLFTFFKNNKGIVKYLLIYLAVFIGLTLLLLSLTNNDYINRYLYNLFEKNLSSTRLILWMHGVEHFMDSPIWGNGYLVSTFSNGYTTPHNAILEWSCFGGIIFCICMLLIIYTTFVKILYFEDKVVCRILASGVVGFLSAYFAEGYSIHITYWLFLIIVLLLNNCEQWIDRFINKEDIT